MNLQLVRSGDLMPTCGSDQIHTPINLEMNGFPIRVVFIPSAPTEKAMAFSISDAGRALGHAVPAHVARHCHLTDDDQGVVKMTTPGGIQSVKVCYWTGLVKLMMHSQMKNAIEFQDWLAAKSSDLTFHGVAFVDRSAAAAAVTPADYYRIAASIERLENQVREQGEEIARLKKQASPKALPAKAKTFADDQLERFLQECTEPAPGHLISNAELTAEHNRWAAENGCLPATPTSVTLHEETRAFIRAGKKCCRNRGRLSKNKSAVLAMRYAGASIKQIAERFGTSMGATWQFLTKHGGGSR